MTESLNDLLNSISVLERSDTKYYKLNDFHSALNKMYGEAVELSDTIITPFYICDSGILEIYDYELNIRLVDSHNKEALILTKTGKKSINEVNPEIVQKLTNCYLEIVKPQRVLLTNILEKYVDYVKTSPQIKERISEYLHEFDNEKLYFEVY
ncbi:hypothetical protein B0P06_000428 [Clostridium saccharoperbutylacetonicum]|uniref:Uncharacterized protein n=1 Tax=Clostridium saccharoperbutylacetonicum N1-4(HMT) TaxID=931276 RepID=M1MKZ3_9CLOT|nr:hypothetical protein [Clostridium saccharoperbutylacetonicum]AGF55476.1 hypothetical protein Cspa_c17060 [Clostridium saccharoperbutylacetonicum N1-4(HMT)]NRT63807.1 hypothetical protein [Clostridium saccharoperbutylacetonicum]NSB27170.1 hypothetical protein [Clostridium saccharoperbutylacetonicum]NSB40657.1 hypothetical protein [Clostridium saccharoperbutylacetonicum]